MNEDNQNDQQQDSQLGRQVGNVAKNGAKMVGELAKAKMKALTAKLSIAMISALSTILPWILIIIFFITVFLPSADYYMNSYINESTSEQVADILSEYCTIDETGVHFDKESILKGLGEAFKNGGIDFDSLGLGQDALSLNGVEFSQEAFNNSQAAQHLYNLMTATLASELPYIEGSDKEAQGIVRIKRKEKTNEEARDLIYIGIDQFNEMVENKDPNIINFFSLDQTWNLWVAKPYEQINEFVKTVNGSVGEQNTQRTYDIIPISIPYRTLISQYTMPFEFLMSLQTITHNSEYVQAVAKLVTESSYIEFTIFDSISITKYTYEVTYDQYSKGLIYVPGDPNAYAPGAQQGHYVPWRTKER